VKITLVPSCFGAEPGMSRQYVTSFLLNDTVALDAGSLGFYRTPAEQARIKHVLLSHSHIDHMASLPTFLENIYSASPDCVTVHGSKAVLDSLRKDIFNNRVWPDFIDLSHKNTPFLKLARLTAGRKIELDGLTITPVPVDHVIPTFGFIVEEQGKAVVFSSDTGPTEALWKAANKLPNLQAVFLEVTFPTHMDWLAEAAGHLTPALFAAEVRKLERKVPIHVVHIKPRHYDQVVQELTALRLPNVCIGQSDRPYVF
jgi:ribonuclease BN (tRNA processing enzyme)